MKVSKFGLFLLIVIGISFATRDRGKIVLQQGLDSYTGCVDSYVSKENPTTKNAGSDELVMEHWWWG